MHCSNIGFAAAEAEVPGHTESQSVVDYLAGRTLH